MSDLEKECGASDVESDQTDDMVIVSEDDGKETERPQEEYWLPNSIEEAQWFCDSINMGEAFWAHGVELANIVTSCARQTLIGKLTSKTVADFGCGVGRVILPLAQEFKEVVGIDCSSTMLKLATEKAAGIENIIFKHTSGRAFPLDRRRYHLIYSFYVLQHLDVSNVKQILQKMYAALHAGGHVLLAFCQMGEPFTETATVRRDTIPVRGTIAYDPTAIRQLATEAGFTVHDIIPYSRLGDDYTYLHLVAYKQEL